MATAYIAARPWAAIFAERLLTPDVSCRHPLRANSPLPRRSRVRITHSPDSHPDCKRGGGHAYPQGWGAKRPPKPPIGMKFPHPPRHARPPPRGSGTSFLNSSTSTSGLRSFSESTRARVSGEIARVFSGYLAASEATNTDSPAHARAQSSCNAPAIRSQEYARAFMRVAASSDNVRLRSRGGSESGDANVIDVIGSLCTSKATHTPARAKQTSGGCPKKRGLAGSHGARTSRRHAPRETARPRTLPLSRADARPRARKHAGIPASVRTPDPAAGRPCPALSLP